MNFGAAKFGFFQNKTFSKSSTRNFSDPDILQKLESGFFRPRHFAKAGDGFFQTKEFSKSCTQVFLDTVFRSKILFPPFFWFPNFFPQHFSLENIVRDNRVAPHFFVEEKTLGSKKMVGKRFSNKKY